MRPSERNTLIRTQSAIIEKLRYELSEKVRVVEGLRSQCVHVDDEFNSTINAAGSCSICERYIGQLADGMPADDDE